MSSGKSAKAARQRQSARERIAAQRELQRRRARTQRVIVAVVTVAVLGLAGGLIAWAIGSKSAKQAAATSGAVTLSTALPPWPAPSDPLAGAHQAGLSVAASEGQVNHFHAHLDIIVNGQPVAVPADIGIDTTHGVLSEMHTHDTSGIIHIESAAANGHYTLGQLFTEWQVRLTPSAIGGLAANGSDSLRAYINGKLFTGDPASISLVSHEEIALIYGPRTATGNPPAYTWNQADFPR